MVGDRPAPTAIVFVYNAEAGLVAGAIDTVHKLVSPATYPCSLCAITYGLAGMRRRWRDWLEAQSLPAVFHHRADFRLAFPTAAAWPLPLVALARGPELEPLLGPEALAPLDLDALMAALDRRLAMAIDRPLEFDVQPFGDG
jgi:hypothetical protein